MTGIAQLDNRPVKKGRVGQEPSGNIERYFKVIAFCHHDLAVCLRTADHPLAQWSDVTRLFGKFHELFSLHSPLHRVIPAQQSFNTVHVPAAQIIFRLVGQED